MKDYSIIHKNLDKYFIIYSDCFLTRGLVKSSILDITNQQMYFFDTQFYDILSTISLYRIREILLMCEDEVTIESFQELIMFLVSKELGAFVENVSLFPPINVEWDCYSIISNAIIDVKNKIHNFEKIFIELNDLFCEKIQIRFYSVVGTDIFHKIIHHAIDKRFSHIEFVIKEDVQENRLEDLIAIVKQYPFIRFTIYNSFKDLTTLKFNNISFIKRDLDFCKDCGVISPEYFIIPTMDSYMENRLYNGCLNRKVSIDYDGNIKNCPSFKHSYGNIENVRIKDVIMTKQFRELWIINKEKIEVCKDCELRPVCTDCRAHLSDPNNIYSKPQKCTYDPLTSNWK